MSLRFRPSAGWGELGFAALGYLAVTLWWLWPLPLHLASHAEFRVGGQLEVLRSLDYYLLLWVLSWGAHGLATDPLHVFDANAFHPSPLSLAFSEHLLGLQPLFAPVYWLTGNAVLGANVVILLSLLLSALATYALARRWVGVPAACLAGLLFAFVPIKRQGLSHFHVLAQMWLPFALLFIDRWLADARRLDLMALTATVVLGVTGSMYLSYGFVFAVGPLAVLALIRWRARLDRRRLWGLVAVSMTGALALAAVALPYIQLRLLGLISEYGETSGNSLGNVFAGAMVAARFDLGARGWVILALVVLGIVAPGVGRRWAAVIGVGLCLVGFAVSLGEQVALGPVVIPLPHALLAAVVPGFSSVRVISRLVFVAELGLALLAALGADRLCRVGLVPLRALAVTALIVLGAAYVAPATPLPLRPVPTCADLHPVHAWLARWGGGRGVVEMPPRRGESAAKMMYRSTCHWQPLVGGASAYTTRVHAVIYQIARGLPHPRAIQRLVDHVDVGWVLVWLDDDQAARWRPEKLQLPPGIAVAARWPDALVLRLDATPSPASVRDRLFSVTHTLDGAALEPLGKTCPGRITLESPPTAVPGRRPLRARVRVHNEGARPLPGNGYVPRHLVYVRTCVLTGEGTRCRGRPQPLGIDIPSGASKVIHVDVAPRPAGVSEPRLVVELIQIGDGPLAECGFERLDLPYEPALDRPVPN